MSETDDVVTEAKKQMAKLQKVIDDVDKIGKKPEVKKVEEKKPTGPTRSSTTITTTTVKEPPIPVDPVQQFMQNQQQQQPQQPFIDQQGIQQVQQMGSTINKTVAAGEVLRWLSMGRIMAFVSIIGLFLMFMFPAIELELVAEITFCFVIIIVGFFLMRFQKHIVYLQRKYGLQTKPLFSMQRRQQQPFYPPQQPPQQIPPQQPPQQFPPQQPPGGL